MAEEKSFDCVRMMREIRTRIDRATAGMNGEARGRWIREQLAAKEQPPAPTSTREAAE